MSLGASGPAVQCVLRGFVPRKRQRFLGCVKTEMHPARGRAPSTSTPHVGVLPPPVTKRVPRMVKYTILPSRRAYRVFPDPRYSAQRTHLGNGSGLPPNQAATKLADRPSTSSHSLFCQLESVAHVPQKHQEQRIVKGTNGSTLLTTSFLPHCGPFVVFLIRCAICPISRFAAQSETATWMW
jgi:hypothetical protein